jgi:hypothetical protein
MARHLSDETIHQLLVEAKPLPPDFLERLQVKPKHGHKESEMDVTGNGGSEFQVILRQSNFNPLDFSIILAYRPPKTNQLFRLRRYNGKSHEHRNMIEGNTFYDFHVHTATQRYQEAGLREDWSLNRQTGSQSSTRH